MDDIKNNIEASIYIIDDTYHIVYFNQKLQEMVPEVRVGEQCHQAFRDSAVPCQGCPMNTENKTSSVYYNQKLKQWIEVNIGKIEWPGKGSCNIIISRNASEERVQEVEGQSGVHIDTAFPFPIHREPSFYQIASEILKEQDNGKYLLVAIDVEHFKLFNEWYGKEAGDQFLLHIANHLKKFDDENGSVSCYLGADDFMSLVPDENGNLERLQERIIGYVRQYSGSAGFLPLLGVYEIIDRDISLATMYDRAIIAMSSIKGNYMERCSRYDEAMMKQLEENHVLFTEVQQGLKNNEFIFYLQPKCNMATGRIVGMESLVRWQHPERGIVAPGVFIPFLEESGFIVKLDIYIWNEVCRYIRKWLDKGGKLLPISVNVSRVDIYTMDVVDYFEKLIDRYRIPPQLLEIEITESDFAEGNQTILQVVEKMQNSGFAVSMDDFGSGYSSLNMLKDINVDVLKLDMKFLEMNENSTGQGLGILEAIIRMARLIGMRMIAEGVETKEQVEFLVDMGCLYGQGYYFYRPLSTTQFEKLLENPENFDYRGIEARKLGNLGVKDLMNADMFSETMIHNILGGIGFYKVNGSDIELIQVNENYYQVTGSNPVDLEEQRKHIQERVYEEDRNEFREIFRRADRDRLNGGAGEVRRFREDGSIIWVQVRIFLIKEQEEGRIYYGAISDITEKKRREEILKYSQKALQSAMHIAERDASFMQLAEENQTTASAIFAQMTPGGMIGGYCEEDFPLYFADSAVIKLLGYENYTEFAEAIHGKVVNTIHPDDREQVAKDIGPEYYSGLEYTTKYRMPKKDGTWFWTLDKGKVIRAEDGRLAIISAFMDISDTMAAQQELEEKNELLERQNHELSFMRNNIPGGYHWCADNVEHDFLYISEQFQEMFGYTEKEISEIFERKYMNMVHPDDRDRVKIEVSNMGKSTAISQFEYRMKSKRGYIWVIDQSQYIHYEGKTVIQGFTLDVTESVNLRNTMKTIMEYTPDCIGFLKEKEGVWTYDIAADGMKTSLGYGVEEYMGGVIGRPDQGHMGTDGRIQLNDDFQEILTKKKEYKNVFKVALPNQKVHWISLTVRYVREEVDTCIFLCVLSDITSLKKKEHDLWMSGQKSRSILRQAQLSSWSWDMSSHILMLDNIRENKGFLEGYVESESGEVTIEDFPACFLNGETIVEEYRGKVETYFSDIGSGKSKTNAQCEFPIHRKDGRTSWVRMMCELVVDEEGNPAEAIGYYLDITKEMQEMIEKQDTLKALEAFRNQTLYDFKVSLSGDKVCSGGGAVQWLEETQGQQSMQFSTIIEYFCENLIAPEDREKVRNFADVDRMTGAYLEGYTTEALDYQRVYNGEMRWMRMNFNYTRSEASGEVFAYIYVTDIDKQKRQEMHLTRLAQTDAMTGLYNRNTARPKIDEYLAMSDSKSAIVIMFDMDNFKLVNDVFGHNYGDYIIKKNAAQLQEFFRKDDIICRMGGDEFLVLCKDVDENRIRQRLERIIKQMPNTYNMGEKTIKLSISAGYAVFPSDGRCFDELYQKADIALFSSKMQGKGTYRRYDASMKHIRYGWRIQKSFQNKRKGPRLRGPKGKSL